MNVPIKSERITAASQRYLRGDRPEKRILNYA